MTPKSGTSRRTPSRPGPGPISELTPSRSKACFCLSQTNVKSCSLQVVFSTADVRAHDPGSLAACRPPVELATALILRHPIPSAELLEFRAMIPAEKPAKPLAFVFGHGLWNDLDVGATAAWLDALTQAAAGRAPWLMQSRRDGRASDVFPRLFVAPNAAGPLKPDEFLVSQGNKALALFEESTRHLASRRGIEHLGTWNMSIQASKYDGSHLDLRGNLVKAMMVLNWLAMLDVDKF